MDRRSARGLIRALDVPAGRRRTDAIRLRAIAKSFAAPVLTDVTLDIPAGEVFGLTGSNGAGKTTLLEILATLQRPTGGTATVGGYDVVRESQSVRRIVGYCPASADSFYPRLTGAANLQFFASLYGMSPRDARARTAAVLDMLGASEPAALMFQRCSAGMKQKLVLGRALLSDPAVVLLDEPTRSLDPAAQGEFRHLVRTLANRWGKTIVLVTHNLDEADEVCDRIALLRDGRIAEVWSTGIGQAFRPASLPVAMDA